MRWVGLALAVGSMAGSNAPARGDDAEEVAGDLKARQGRWASQRGFDVAVRRQDEGATANGQDYTFKVTLNAKATEAGQMIGIPSAA